MFIRVLALMLVFTFCNSSNSQVIIEDVTTTTMPLTQCDIWLEQTQYNAREMKEVLDYISESTNEYSIGLISKNRLLNALDWSLNRTQMLLDDQTNTEMKSLVPNSNNQVSHTYYITGMQYTLTGIETFYSGIYNNRDYEVNQGADWIIKADNQFKNAVQRLNSC